MSEGSDKAAEFAGNLRGMTIYKVKSWRETLERHAALHSRVRVQVSSIGGYLHDWTGTIERLAPIDRHCFIDGHMVSFRMLIRLTTPDGDVIENPDSIENWKAAMAERAEEKRTTERVRMDESFVPPSINPLTAIKDVPLKGRQRTGYLGTYEWGERDILLLAKDAPSAERAFRLISTNEGFWTISGALLKGRVIWPAWHQMMTHLCQRAEELRKGQPPLAHDCTYEQEQERIELYKESGLNILDYVDWQPIRWLETYIQVDWEALFDWANGKPAGVLSDFMAKAWNSNEFLPTDGGDLGREMLVTLKAYGLVELEPVREFTLRELADYASIKELRAWIAEAGSGFKARTGDVLREHLIELAPPFLEDRLRGLTPTRMLRMVQPEGWTWAEFQRARKLYESMTNDLKQYQFNGWTKEKARVFLTPQLKGMSYDI